MSNPALALVLLITLAAIAPFPSPLEAETQAPDPRFGIVEAYVNPAAAGEAGAGYTRVILRWDVIQPASRDDWKPANVPDPFIDAELAAGRQVVGLLIGTPAWAARDPAQGAKAVPNMFDWDRFVHRIVQQYRGRINHWVIWNEPDVWDEAHPGSTWAGTEQDYFQLLRTAYLAIRSEDPSLQVTLAGLTYYWDWSHGRRSFLDRLLDIIVADPEAPSQNYYFDAVVYHLYFKPEQVWDVLGEAKGSLSRHGIAGKELWVNETNAPPSDDPQELPWSTPRFSVSLEEQAAFLIQEFATAFAAGASRVEVYKLRNSPNHPESIEPYGLLRGDDSRRPAFAAFRVLTTYLGGFRSAALQRAGDLRAVTFDRGETTTTVFWTVGRTAAQVPVRSIASEATLVDELGQTRTLRAANGVYLLDLPGAACTQQTECFIGGAPRLLVENGPADGRQAMMAFTAPTATAPAPTPGLTLTGSVEASVAVTRTLTPAAGQRLATPAAGAPATATLGIAVAVPTRSPAPSWHTGTLTRAAAPSEVPTPLATNPLATSPLATNPLPSPAANAVAAAATPVASATPLGTPGAARAETPVGSNPALVQGVGILGLAVLAGLAVWRIATVNRKR